MHTHANQHRVKDDSSAETHSTSKASSERRESQFDETWSVKLDVGLAKSHIGVALDLLLGLDSNYLCVEDKDVKHNEGCKDRPV